MKKTCLIIGNGPSLREVPDLFLEKFHTFGTNRIYTRFVPNYYVCINPLVCSQFLPDIEQLQTKKYIRAEYAKDAGGTPLYSSPIPHFSRDPLKVIYEGYTVTYACMQLAFWMGYQTVLLVGLDHYYEYNGKPNEQQVLEGNDPNHFDPNYFKGVEWNLPDLEQSEKAYKMAKVVFETDGRQIINLTEGTHLDVFEKGSIGGWMF